MKNSKLQIVALCIVFFICGSFTNNPNSGKVLNNSKQTTSTISEKCLSFFTNNLDELGAVVYIPDTRLDKAAELGFSKIAPATINSTETYDLYNVYDQVTPVADPNYDCSSKIMSTANDLQMIIFVNKSKALAYKKLGFVKVEAVAGQTDKLQGKHLKTETLNVTINSKEIKYVPVFWASSKK
jgi:hypothetical protein